MGSKQISPVVSVTLSVLCYSQTLVYDSSCFLIHSKYLPVLLAGGWLCWCPATVYRSGRRTTVLGCDDFHFTSPRIKGPQEEASSHDKLFNRRTESSLH